MPQSDHVVTWSGNPCEHDRRFVGFGARRSEKALLQLSWSNLREVFRQSNDGFVGKKRRGVLELIELGFYLRSYLGIAMSDADRNDAAEEVEIFIALDVP